MKVYTLPVMKVTLKTLNSLANHRLCTQLETRTLRGTYCIISVSNDAIILVLKLTVSKSNGNRRVHLVAVGVVIQWEISQYTYTVKPISPHSVYVYIAMGL